MVCQISNDSAETCHCKQHICILCLVGIGISITVVPLTLHLHNTCGCNTTKAMCAYSLNGTSKAGRDKKIQTQPGVLLNCTVWMFMHCVKVVVLHFFGTQL